MAVLLSKLMSLSFRAAASARCAHDVVLVAFGQDGEADLAGLLVVDGILGNLAQLLANALLGCGFLESLQLSLAHLNLELAADVLVLTLELSNFLLLSVCQFTYL